MLVAMSSGAKPTFSIVVPSAGRPTLGRTLQSIASQVEPGDEIIVIVNDYGEEGGGYGNRARQEGMEKASGSHVLFCDDDDVFLPGALVVMRQYASEHPNRLGLFRRTFNARGVIQWSEPVLRRGNLQCQCMCVPNIPGKLARWVPGEPLGEPWTDTMFAQQTAELLGAEPVWCDVAVGLARPERNPWRRFRYWLSPRHRARRLLGARGGERPAWDAQVWRPN